MLVSPDGQTPISSIPKPEITTPLPETNRIENLEPIEKSKLDAAIDLFSPESLKLDQSLLDSMMASPLLTTIECVKPHDQIFVQVHPGKEYPFLAALIEHQEERGARYLIHPSFLPHIGNIKFHFEWLFLYTSRQGVLGFWPIKQRKDNRENSWLESAEQAAQVAKTAWVSIATHQQSRRYVVSKAIANFPPPKWEEITQGKTLYELLRTCFRERVITSEEHPVIQKFRGAI
jgi:hypothetical protein